MDRYGSRVRDGRTDVWVDGALVCREGRLGRYCGFEAMRDPLIMSFSTPACKFCLREAKNKLANRFMYSYPIKCLMKVHKSGTEMEMRRDVLKS